MADDEQPLEHFDRPVVRWWPVLAASFVVMLACLPLVAWASAYGEWTCTTADFDRARLNGPRIAWIGSGIAVGAPLLGAALLDRRRGHRTRARSKTLVGLIPISLGLIAAVAVAPVSGGIFCW